MIRNAGFWTSLVVFALALVIFLTEPQATVALRNIAFDTYQRLQPRAYHDAGVRILDIDNESLARLGQWPWPRSILAAMIERLTEQGVKVIAFDVIFAEKDRTSPATSLKAWSDRPEVAEVLRQLPDYDQLFAEAIAKAPVVLAFSVSPAPNRAAKPMLKGRFAQAGDNPRLFLPAYRGTIASLAEFQEAASGNGAIRFVEDTGGIIRRVPAVFRLQEEIYPALWAEALRIATGDSSYLIRSSGASGDKRAGFKSGIVSINTGSRQIPTDARGQVWLHFTEPRAERYIPAWHLFAEGQDLSGLKDAIVFVGASAPGLKDLRFTPFGAVPGVEIHAQALEQALQQSFLSRPDWARAVEILFLLLLWLALLYLISRLGALWSAIIAFIAVCSAIMASWYAFSAHKLMIDPLLPTLLAITLYIACSLPRHMQTERQQRWIRQAFSTYISPNLVQHLIDHPESLRLGGERRECSFVLTDLAGFTALVERSDPADIVSLLNEYLDGMIAIALEHEGTLDRIIGDAVAVMFSAPVEQPDHADRAVACALAMDAFAVQFSAAQQAKRRPVGRTRIGVNTGHVIIGNVGGKSLFDYRALGDAINTTSRLESINRQLGTNICISGETAARTNQFCGRPIGDLMLAGKSESVFAFEPLTPEKLATPEIQSYLAAYELLESGSSDAADAFRRLVQQAPEDPLARFHAERLMAGESGTTIVFESK